MWKAPAIAVTGIAVLAGSATFALHRYDASRSDLIAEGVSVGGVDVGGLRVEAAQARLQRVIARRLDRPLTLTHAKRRFVVEAGLVDVHTDAGALAQAALAESREGNFFTRAMRDLRGERLEADLPVPVEYSKEAVGRVVAGLRRAIDRPAREATSSVSLDGVQITASQVGVAVRPRLLRRAIVNNLVRLDADRRFAVPSKRLMPKVTTEELRQRFHTFIAISRSTRQLRLYVDLRLAKTYQVGIGTAGFETPSGLHRIRTKAADPAWYVPNKPWAGDLAGQVIPAGDPRNPIEARWMGFYDGAGIHGTSDIASVGTAASHGCIRMIPREVIELYERVPLNTPLYIA
jgi:hypothetical protein